MAEAENQNNDANGNPDDDFSINNSNQHHLIATHVKQHIGKGSFQEISNELLAAFGCNDESARNEIHDILKSSEENKVYNAFLKTLGTCTKEASTNLKFNKFVVVVRRKHIHLANTLTKHKDEFRPHPDPQSQFQQVLKPGKSNYVRLIRRNVENNAQESPSNTGPIDIQELQDLIPQQSGSQQSAPTGTVAVQSPGLYDNIKIWEQKCLRLTKCTWVIIGAITLVGIILCPTLYYIFSPREAPAPLPPTINPESKNLTEETTKIVVIVPTTEESESHLDETLTEYHFDHISILDLDNNETKYMTYEMRPNEPKLSQSISHIFASIENFTLTGSLGFDQVTDILSKVGKTLKVLVIDNPNCDEFSFIKCKQRPYFVQLDLLIFKNIQSECPDLYEFFNLCVNYNYKRKFQPIILGTHVYSQSAKTVWEIGHKSGNDPIYRNSTGAKLKVDFELEKTPPVSYESFIH